MQLMFLINNSLQDPHHADTYQLEIISVVRSIYFSRKEHKMTLKEKAVIKNKSKDKSIYYPQKIILQKLQNLAIFDDP